MKTSLLLMISTSVILSFTGCSATKTKEVEAPKPVVADKKKLVGRIASIPAGQKFVLIQSYDKWQGKAGEILTTEGPNKRAANLLATGEALGQYAAADIQAGLVEVGDGVFSQPVAPPVVSEPVAPAPVSPAPKPVASDPSESPLIPVTEPKS